MSKPFNMLLAAAIGIGTLGVPFLPRAASAADSMGCCMVRDGDRYPWVQVGTDFEDCEKRNKRDPRGDDIFEPQGRVWWNLEC